MLNTWVFAIFVVFQFIDGVLTYYGVTISDVYTYEANPIAIALIEVLGIIPAMMFLKIGSIALGALICTRGNQKLFGINTIQYLWGINAFYVFVTARHIMALQALTKISGG